MTYHPIDGRDATPGASDPAHRFTPQPGTLWLRPRLLLQSAGLAVISGVLGQFNDKRETMGSLAADPPLDLHQGYEEAWVDYVSDTGDGFDATYAIASLVGRQQLDLAHAGKQVTTARGQLLVMGGDQCYPSADVKVYEDRLIGPYRAALPQASPAPHLLAIPGNHDWYDGLTAFMRTFCQRRNFGGWQTAQSRSYFAVRLPGRWWLWGVDIQFDTYIDDVQRRYFQGMADQLQAGDAVIMCSAKPSWVSTAEDDLEAYATLDFLDRTLIRPRGAHLRVCLSGDRHHYVRYEAEDGGQRVTAGGGGAYLSPTHHLPRSITVPPAQSRAIGKSDPVDFTAKARFPDRDTSRRLRWGVLRLPWRTPGLTVLMGSISTLLMLAMVRTLGPAQATLPQRIEGTAAALEGLTLERLAASLVDSLGALTLALLVLAAAVAFTNKRHRWWAWAIGLTHGAAHIAVAVVTTYACAALVSGLPGTVRFAGLVPLVFVIGGLVGTELIAVYLVLVDRVRLNTNELYAAQGIPDQKNFLRLHVDRHGDLTIYAIGLPHVPRRWRVRQGSPDVGPRIVPVDRELEPVLIEAPVPVSPTPMTVTRERVHA